MLYGVKMWWCYLPELKSTGLSTFQDKCRVRFILVSVLSILTLSLSSFSYSSSLSAPVSIPSSTSCFCVPSLLCNHFFSFIMLLPCLLHLQHFLPPSTLFLFSTSVLHIFQHVELVKVVYWWRWGRGWCSYMQLFLWITEGWRSNG